MYKNMQYHELPINEVTKRIEIAAETWPDATRVFLGDGDVMAIGREKLLAVLQLIRKIMPRVKRISMYANGHSIATHDTDTLTQMKANGLHTVYLGLESGDDTVLHLVRKRETAAEMIEAVQRVQDIGIRASVMILIGIGGKKYTQTHAQNTAHALNIMQPRILSALRCIPIPGTPLHTALENGVWEELTEYDSLREMHAILSASELTRTVFRANHSSNFLPLEARLPKEKNQLLNEIENVMASDAVSRTEPAAPPLFM